MSIRRGYAATACGEVHYARCGDGPAVLLLHQSPRSWDEYREVLPLLGRRFTAIAMDTLGFGSSAPGPARPCIEDYARAAVAFLDALSLDRVHVVGHHTGAVVAMELAASAPERVDRLVLSSCPWIDAKARRRRSRQMAIDAVEPMDDGSHLAELWRRRQAFYPPHRPDLLHRFVRDALAVADAETGHRAVGAYEMDQRVPLVRAPALLIGADADPFAFPDLHHLRQALPGAAARVISGGHVPLPDERPEEFADAVLSFLESAR